MSTKTIQSKKTQETEKTPNFVKETLEQLEPLKSWPNYDLYTFRVWQKNLKTGQFEPTNYQRIQYNGRFVNYMSTMYHVLPNEDVQRTADLVADVIDAKQHAPKVKFHNPKFGWCKPAGHVINNPEKTVMVAHYTIGEPVDITGKDDFVEFGFGVANSIDGKGGAFKVFPYTYREACDNVSYHITQTATLHSGIKAPALQNLKKGFSYNAWKDRNSIELDKSPELQKCVEAIKKAKAEFKGVSYKKAHFSTLDLEYVTNSILTVVENGKKLREQYKKLYKTKVTLKNAQLLWEKLPKSVMTSKKIQSWLDYDKKEEKLELKKPVTEWKAFNDITDALTRGERNFNSTMEAYAKLDEILVRTK